MANHKLSIPFLQTAQIGPLQLLERRILENNTKIEAWFRERWQETPPVMYGSVDLRNAGFKLAPVDMNLYPAGFNNLNKDLIPLAIQAAETVLVHHLPCCKNIAIIPESHTRNPMYWENVSTLQSILTQAGFDVRIGGLPDTFSDVTKMTTPSGKTVTITPLRREGNHLYLNNFLPCLFILNNDLSNGIPDLLKNLQQKICPPAELGWHSRLKSIHFHHYQQIADDFARLIDIDPWLIDPLFRYCGEVNFMERAGEDCLVRNVEQLLQAIQRKYDTYGVTHEPFVIVKADAGTYGMGVMMVKSARELRDLNRKQRSKMSASKGSRAVHQVIIQEGVYTFERWGEAQSTAEPVVYMIGQYVIGGFYRLHKDRSNQESLNTPGMYFEPLQFVKACNTPDDSLSPDDCPNRFYAYGVVARLSMLAAAREKQELNLV